MVNVVIQTVIRRHQALVKGQYILKPFFVLSLTMLMHQNAIVFVIELLLLV